MRFFSFWIGLVVVFFPSYSASQECPSPLFYDASGELIKAVVVVKDQGHAQLTKKVGIQLYEASNDLLEHGQTVFVEGLEYEETIPGEIAIDPADNDDYQWPESKVRIYKIVIPEDSTKALINESFLKTRPYWLCMPHLEKELSLHFRYPVTYEVTASDNVVDIDGRFRNDVKPGKLLFCRSIAEFRLKPSFEYDGFVECSVYSNLFVDRIYVPINQIKPVAPPAFKREYWPEFD